jgi:hypothetical protein
MGQSDRSIWGSQTSLAREGRTNFGYYAKRIRAAAVPRGRTPEGPQPRRAVPRVRIRYTPYLGR